MEKTRLSFLKILPMFVPDIQEDVYINLLMPL